MNIRKTGPKISYDRRSTSNDYEISKATLSALLFVNVRLMFSSRPQRSTQGGVAAIKTYRR